MLLTSMGIGLWPQMPQWFVPLDEWVFVARARNIRRGTGRSSRCRCGCQKWRVTRRMRR